MGLQWISADKATLAYLALSARRPYNQLTSEMDILPKHRYRNSVGTQDWFLVIFAKINQFSVLFDVSVSFIALFWSEIAQNDRKRQKQNRNYSYTAYK